jgi:hypothetical protein
MSANTPIPDLQTLFAKWGRRKVKVWAFWKMTYSRFGNRENHANSGIPRINKLSAFNTDARFDPHGSNIKLPILNSLQI